MNLSGNLLEDRVLLDDRAGLLFYPGDLSVGYFSRVHRITLYLIFTA